MENTDSYSVFRTRKDIEYAKFFLEVGKRSDAQDRLNKALVNIEEATRDGVTVTNETRQLMDLTDEIHALWEESRQTSDPPGSAFVLAMGDMVFLATPGGGMTAVNLDKGQSKNPVRASPSSSRNSSSSSSRNSLHSSQDSIYSWHSMSEPETEPSPEPETEPSPEPETEPAPRTGFFDRFKGYYGGGRSSPDEQSPPEPEPETEPAPRTGFFDRFKGYYSGGSSPHDEQSAPESSDEQPTSGSDDEQPASGSPYATSYDGFEYDPPFSEEESMFIRYEEDSEIMTIHNAPGKSSESMEEQVGYSIAMFGTEPKARPRVFLEALEGVTHGGKNKNKYELLKRRPQYKRDGDLSVEKYYHEYIHPVCVANNGTGLGVTYEKTYLRYIQGMDDTSDDYASKQDVNKVDCMILQTVPVREDLGTRNDPGSGIGDIVDGGGRWVSAFSFLEFNEESIHISLICSSSEKPVLGHDDSGIYYMPNGKLMLKKIYSIASYFGYDNVTLDAIPTTVGIYLTRGFITQDSSFNSLFKTFNDTVRSVPASDDSLKKKYNTLIKGKIQSVRNTYNQEYAKHRHTPNLQVERQNPELYRRYVATTFLLTAQESGKLVPTLLAMRLGGSSDVGTLYDKLSDEFTEALTNVYTMDKYGNVTIRMHIKV